MAISINELIIKLDNMANTDFTEALNRACLVVENDAKKNAPVGTGELRNSITHYVDGDTGVVGTNLDYAPYVEYGTGVFAAAGNGRLTPWSYLDALGNWHTTIGQAPQPFLIPALEDNIDEIKHLFILAMDKELKK